MIDQPFDVLEGLEAWGAKIGVGTFLTIEFGPVDRVDGIDHGRYHLWISYAAWRLSWTTGWVGSGDSKAAMQLGVSGLNGSKLVAAKCTEFGDLILEFSAGRTLRTLSNMEYDDSPPWDLFAPGHVYSGVPRAGQAWTSETRS